MNDVLEKLEPEVQFLKFGDSSLDFRLLVWTNKPRAHTQIKSDINYRIERLFRGAGIEIPSPQFDVRLRGAGITLTSEGELLAEESTDPNNDPGNFRLRRTHLEPGNANLQTCWTKTIAKA